MHFFLLASKYLEYRIFLLMWGLADRVSLLWLTLAVLRVWGANATSLTLMLARSLCGNGEWSRRTDTQSTSWGSVLGHLLGYKIQF